MAMPDLSKKVGPFPLYIWIVAGAGGIGLYFYLNRETGESDEETESESNELIPGVGVGVGAGASTDNSDTVSSDTNEAWQQRAIRYLVDKGNSPLVAQGLIGKYLASVPITSAEKPILDMVLKNVGFPPDPPDTSPAASDELVIKKWSSPAVRKTSNPNWADGRGVASKDYTWLQYLETHYDSLPPSGDFRRQILAGWVQAYNGAVSRVRKGMNVKIPKYVWLKKWPTNTK